MQNIITLSMPLKLVNLHCFRLVAFATHTDTNILCLLLISYETKTRILSIHNFTREVQAPNNV